MGLEYDLKALTHRLDDDRKQRQLRRRICGYILDGSAAGRLQRLEDVAIALERAVQQQPDAKPAIDALFQTLSAELFNRKQLALLIDSWWLTHRLLRRVVRPDLATTSKVAWESDKLRVVALMQFETECWRYLGESLERSIQFALVALERIGRSTQRLSDVATRDDQREPFTCLKQDWSVLFGNAAASPDAIEKRWIHCLIAGAAGGDHVASEVLDAMLSTLAMFREDNQVEVVVPPDRTEHPAHSAIETLRDNATSPPDHTKPVLRLDAVHDRKFTVWKEHVGAEGERARARGEVVISWMIEHQESIIDALDERWRQICEEPRRGLRPGGREHIDITITPLRNAGVRAVIFRPEGYTFPDVGLDIVIRRESPHLFVYRTSLDQIESIPSEAFENVSHPNLDAIRYLLVAAVIDALHHLIVGRRKLRTLGEVTAAARTVERLADPPAPVPMRSCDVPHHIRRLPIGRKPRPPAQERAAASGWKLPPGFTFVSAYCQNRKLVYDLPTDPTAVYTDDDLFDLEGGT